MATVEVAEDWADSYARTIGPFRDLAKQYHDDPGYRRRVETDPVATFREKGIDLPDNTEVRIRANTDDKLYILMPSDSNRALEDATLETVSGGVGGFPFDQSIFAARVGGGSIFLLNTLMQQYAADALGKR